MEKKTEVSLKKTKPRLNWNKVMKKTGTESLYELAEKLGVAYPNVFKMLEPTYNPKFETLVDISKKLKIKIRDLIEE